MHRTIARSVATITAALVILTLGPSADAGDVEHTDVASESAAPFTPQLSPDGFRPYALTIHQVGPTMFVGGRFRVVQNAAGTRAFRRRNVFGFDRFTGAVTDFAPRVNGKVWSVTGVGNDVYVAGEFTRIDGVARPGVAKLDADTGLLDTEFDPSTAIKGGRVTDLELSSGRLFASGAFDKKLVALSPRTGALLPYVDIPVTDPLRHTTRAEVFRFGISSDGDTLVAVGNFRTVDGQRRHRAFMLHLGDAAAGLSSWYYPPLERACHAARLPGHQSYLKDVDFAPDSRFFTFASSGGHRIDGEGPGQVLCDSAARFSVSDPSPTVPVWINYTGGDTLHSVVDTGAAVYVQGHSRWLDNPYGVENAGPGAVERRGGGAIDPVAGKALPWDPGMPQRKGGYQIFANQQGLWFATDGRWFGGEHHRGIRLAPLG